MKKNISHLKNCYGCGVCNKICPPNIIEIVENKDGFYSPKVIAEDKCIECGLCLKVCSFNNPETSQRNQEGIAAYAAWSNNANIRNRCSSGGIGFEIGKYLIEKGYQAVGVRYDVRSDRAEHYVAKNLTEFIPSMGSKYIPSDLSRALHEILKGRKYLITGTPCQIASFRRYIKLKHIEEEYVLLDFFCHGVPSLLVWDKYISSVRDAIGELKYVSWRNKETGWQDSWSIQSDASSNYDMDRLYDLNFPDSVHQYSSRRSSGDMFYRFFLGNLCLNRCCYDSCIYKMCNSQADIRIGDFWGKKYESNSEGVSAVLAFTDRGKAIMDSLVGRCTITQESVSEIASGQMVHNARKPMFYTVIMRGLRSRMSLRVIYNLSSYLTRIINKLKRMSGYER